jgi:hypothetical protein
MARKFDMGIRPQRTGPISTHENNGVLAEALRDIEWTNHTLIGSSFFYLLNKPVIRNKAYGIRNK